MCNGITRSRPARRLVRRGALVLFLSIFSLVVVGPGTASADTPVSNTSGTTPLAIAPGAPAGSYPLSGFEHINPYNGNLNIILPLLQMAGRGGSQIFIPLKIDSVHWTVQSENFPDADGRPRWLDAPVRNWWYGLQPGYGPGVLQGRQGGDQITNCNPDPSNPNYVFTVTLARLTFTAPDGTEYELRDQQTGGVPFNMNVGNPCNNLQFFDRGKVFVTADGTSARFISTSDISDDLTIYQPGSGYDLFYPTGELMLRDGTHYHIVGGLVMWVQDRNGNRTTYTYDANNRVASIADSLNRMVFFDYAYPDVAPYGICDRIRYSGGGGVQRMVRIKKDYLANLLRKTEPGDPTSPLTDRQLFPDLNGGSGSTPDNPSNLISAVWLPDGIRKYSFFYNVYGEVTRVELPTGGAIEYDFAAGEINQYTGGVVGFIYGLTAKSNVGIYRRLVERRVYSNGGFGTSFESRTTYSRPESVIGGTYQNLGYVAETVFDGAGSLLSMQNHHFIGNPSQTLFNTSPVGRADWNEGKEIETEFFDTNGTTVLRRVDNTWADAPIPGGPRITDTQTTLRDQNMIAKQHFGYDSYNNRTSTDDYDYGLGQPGPKIRLSTTSYVAGSSYLSDSVYLISLPQQQSVYDAVGQERSRVVYEYDNYTAGLTLRSGVSGHDPTFDNTYVTRGNVTDIASGLPGDNPSEVRNQYDILGNVIQKAVLRTGSTYDTTTIDYSSAFQFAYATMVTSPIPDPSANNGQAASLITTTDYDLSTGHISSQTDPNRKTTYAYYNDPGLLERLTQISRPDGGTTTYVYGDSVGNLYLQTQTSIDSSQTETAKQLFDGLGRLTESQMTVPEGGYITTQQTYDGMGRVSQKSNPYRPAGGEGTAWTTTRYDGLSRVISVTGPDGSVAYTAYNGNRVLAKDQAGKERIVQTDAGGRLTDVWEITPSDAWTVSVTFPNYAEVTAGYHTLYGYDALDDLASVQQGAQPQRTFTYDSLKRLKSAQNPESGRTSYTYSNNGNLSTKTDARPVTTTYGYDAIGRLITRTYSDRTPPVNLKYDGAGLGAANSSGRLTSTISPIPGPGVQLVSRTDILAYDVMGRPTQSQQTTNTGNVYGQLTYGLTYSYNLAGVMTDETYPSNKTVHIDVDSAARIAGVKNSSASTYYAGSFAADSANRIAYASHGAVARMKLGNGLWDQTNFNNRLQPTEIGLGSTANTSPNTLIDGSKMDLVYDYGTNNNNGNVLGQSIKIGNTTIGDQRYGYDYLNRLTSATENGGTSWGRTFNYDPFGNMWVTSPQGIGITQATPQSIDNYNAGTNQLKSPSVYDSAGNQTTDLTGNASAYDAENRLTSFNGPAGTYTYDGDGRRVVKTTSAGTSVFVYDVHGKLIAEYGGATSTGNAGTNYLTTDHLGSTRVVTNSLGNVVARHDYLPFGEEIVAPNIGGRTAAMGYGATDDTRQKFTSKERDSESNLDYFGARYYAGNQGRWTSADPRQDLHGNANEPQAWNLYQYVLNAPLTGVDHDGRQESRMEGENYFRQQLKRDGWSDEQIEEAIRGYRHGQNQALAAGAAAAALAIAAYFAPEALAGAATWAALHPEFVETSGNAVLEMSTGGPGGSGNFIAQSRAAGEAVILQNAASGRAFEKGVIGILGAERNTARILKGEATGAAFRVPDLLDHFSKTLGEIKGQAYLNLGTGGGQLRDLIEYARKTDYSFSLYVRPDTKLAGPLVDALKRIGAKVYDVVDGRVVERVLQ